MDVVYLKINDNLECNLPYVHSGCWSNKSKLNLEISCNLDPTLKNLFCCHVCT